MRLSSDTFHGGGPDRASMTFRHGAQALALDETFTTPSTQTLPASVAAALALTGRTFTELWTFDVASGAVTGTAGNAFTPSTSPRYQMTVPAWNGSSMTALKAIEWQGTATGQCMLAPNATLYDLTQSLTWVWCVRLLRSPAADRGFFAKRVTGTGAGYEIRIVSGGSGRPQLRVGDDATTATAEASVSPTNALDGFGDGSLQWFAFKMDLTSGNATVYGYRAAGTPVAMPAGSKSNAGQVRLAGQNFLNSCELLQMLWAGVLVGAEAEAFDLTALNALDTVGTKPSILARYERQCHVAPRVAYESGFGYRVQHCHGSTSSTALVHFPHLYHPSATLSTQKLGMLCGPRGTAVGGNQKQNKFLWSSEFDNAAWTKTNVTVTADAAEDPAGFTGACQLTASAANGIVSQAVSAAANKTQTCSWYVRRVGGSDVALKLRAVDVAAAATINTFDRTATSEWTRIEAYFQDADATSIRFELEIVANGASIYAAYAQAEEGSVTEYQAQRAALLDRKPANYYIANTAGNYYDPAGGTIEVTATNWYDDAYAIEDAYVFSTGVKSGVLNGGRMFLQVNDPNGVGNSGGVDEPYNTEVSFFDGDPADGNDVSAQVCNYNIDRNAEIVYTVTWDASRGRAILGQTGSDNSQVSPNGVAGSWIPVAASDITILIPGARYSFGDDNTQSTHFEGGIERLRIWKRTP